MGIAPDRKALVTGGGSGFGLEIARRLVDARARVAVMDISEPGLQAAAEELGPALLPIRADVRDAGQVADAVRLAAERFDGLDTLVISAGIIHIKPLAEVSEADWDLTLDVNLKGAFLAMQAAAPYLVASGPGRGRIVAISSDAGKRGFSWIQAYTASKFGLLGLVESVAVELAGSGVTVNAACPVGAPTTAMGRQVLDFKMRATGKAAVDIVAAAAKTNPLGRNATEGDVAAAVTFFISDEAAFLTGVALDVDGGAHLGFLPGT
ncbi:MAG TPA: SDR family oxidoreductase [Candidatus Limnocylindrales bacterium]|nr:SDR family oxidoreductase [Candidatus Limnocylindrales bacterium]